jgi:TPR repeat protein
LVPPAADQGLGFAQNSLGNMYHDGQGVPQNYAQALAWFRMAAEQSHRKTSGNKLRSRVLGRHRLRRNPLPERKYP